MRWLFLFVLTLNLAYIGWHLSQSDFNSYQDVPPLKNVKPILLISELGENQQDKKAPGPAQLNQAQLDQKQQATAKAAGKGEEPQAEKKAPVMVASNDKPVVAKTTAAVDKPAVKVGQKKLEPEKQKPEKAAAEKVDPVKTEKQNAPLQAGSCFTLGPFRDLDNLRGLTREIKSYVIETDFRGNEETEPALYWVYIQPEKDRKKAIETGKRLKAKNIKDFYVIREGEKINGLSLGHFRNKAGAYGLAKKVGKLGFDVMVEPVFKSYTVYWLDYRLAPEARVPESVISKYIRVNKQDTITRLQRQCP